MMTDGEERDHDDRSDLHHGVAPLSHHQQRLFEFERNDPRKNHSKHGLEGRIVGWVETSGQNEAEQDFQAQGPQGGNDDNGDQCREAQHDEVFEPLI
jgi:hypothetical protein